MRIVCDIETNLKHDKIHVVITKDIDTGEVRSWKEAKPFQDFIKDATLIVAHNGIGFDFPVLNRLWNTKIGLKRVFDTLIASRLLDPSREQGHSLEAWGRTLKHQKLDYKAVWQWMMDRKEEYDGERFDNPVPLLLDHYCSMDVEVTCDLYSHLTMELDNKGFSQESIDLEHKVAAIIAEQERHGFKLDTIYATVLLTDIKGKMAGIYEQMQHRWPPIVTPRFHKKSGKPIKDSVVTFNPGSRKQIGEKLIELGWKPKQFTGTGQPMVDEGILEQIIKECEK